jgi:hypothetical protein
MLETGTVRGAMRRGRGGSSSSRSAGGLPAGIVGYGRTATGVGSGLRQGGDACSDMWIVGEAGTVEDTIAVALTRCTGLWGHDTEFTWDQERSVWRVRVNGSPR